MIDLSNPKFYYTKEEVDAYISENQTTVEDLLQTLIHLIRQKARVPVSHFQVGAGMYCSSGRIFLGTNIEIAHSAINHTVHAEQCTLANLFIHSFDQTKERILIMAVTETPCGHCRQILQELPSARDIRIIVKKVGMDCSLHSLLPFTFELPINGVVHSLFDQNAKLATEAELLSLQTYLNETIYPLTRLSEPEWETISHRIVDLYQQSFAWYSGGPAVAIFVSCQKIAMGGIIESSAYNPTINPLQMAVIDCQIEDIPYDVLTHLILIERKGNIFSYQGFLGVLSDCLPKQFGSSDRKLPVIYKQIECFVCSRMLGIPKDPLSSLQ